MSFTLKFKMVNITHHDEINVKLLKQKAVKYFYLVIGQPLSFALRIESMQEGRNKQAF